MNKHTPGPWVVREAQSRNINFLEVEISGGNPRWLEKVAVVYGSTNPMLDTMVGAKYVNANARLIASAPDLVIELRQAIIQMEMAAECIENGRYDEALLHVSILMRSKKEVLAKATGESA